MGKFWIVSEVLSKSFYIQTTLADKEVKCLTGAKILVKHLFKTIAKLFGDILTDDAPPSFRMWTLTFEFIFKMKGVFVKC